MKMQKLIVIAAIALVAMLGQLNASPIFTSQTVVFGPGGAPLTVPANYAVPFALFDSSLGTLTSVKVTVATNLLFSLNAQNFDLVNSHPVTQLQGSATTTLNAFSGNITIVMPANVNVPTPPMPTTLTAYGTPGAILTSSLAGTGSGTFTATSGLGGWQALGGGTDSTNLLLTSGSVSVTGVSDGATLPPIGLPAVWFSGGATEHGTITITYGYEMATPEPISMALVGGSLMGLGLFASRRRQRRS